MKAIVFAAIVMVSVTGCLGQTLPQRAYETARYYEIVAEAGAEYAQTEHADRSVVGMMAAVNANAIRVNKELTAALASCLAEQRIELEASGFTTEPRRLKCDGSKAAIKTGMRTLNGLRDEIQSLLAAAVRPER